MSGEYDFEVPETPFTDEEFADLPILDLPAVLQKIEAKVETTTKAMCGCILPLSALGRTHVCPPKVSREDLTKCRCGRRLAVIYVCVYCRKEEDDCKCVDLSVEP